MAITNLPALQGGIQRMRERGRNVAACDETPGTLRKRHEQYGFPWTEETPVALRRLILSADLNLLAGMLLRFDLLGAQFRPGMTFGERIAQTGAMIISKLDLGVGDFAGGLPGDKLIIGADSAAERVSLLTPFGPGYSAAKFRSTFLVRPGANSSAVFRANALAMAEYARVCQSLGVIPIPEPEVLRDGKHSARECFDVTKGALLELFAALSHAGVDLSDVILKVNPVSPGEDVEGELDARECADLTLQLFEEVVPAGLEIALLSGGISPAKSRELLNLVCQTRQLLASYGRANQHYLWTAYARNPDDGDGVIRAAEAEWSATNAALRGEWTPEMEADLEHFFGNAA